MRLLNNRIFKALVPAVLSASLLGSVLSAYTAEKAFLVNGANENASITREEVCDMLFELGTELGISFGESTQSPYSDCDSKSVSALSEAGIVSGVGNGMFDPDGILTREQICTMLTRLIGKANPDIDVSIHPRYFYDDNSYISYWAKYSVDYLYYHGIIKGTAENVISPLDTLTHGQAAAFCERTYEHKDSFKLKEETPDFEWAIEPQFDGLVPNTKFACGLASVSKNGKYGYINQNGEVVIPFSYDRTYDFSDGVAKVEKDGKFGYINKNGEKITEIIFEDGGDAAEDRIWVKKDGKIGFIDKTGKEVIPFIYDYAYHFEEGLAAVKKDGLYGYINPMGETVIPFKFKWACCFSNGFARVGEGGYYSYIDKSGEIAIDCKYHWLFDFTDDSAVVFHNESWAVINTEGKLNIPFKVYAQMTPSSEGIMKLHLDETHESRYGFQDSSFKEEPIINRYTETERCPRDAGSYHEGLVWSASFLAEADVWISSYLDKKGNPVYPKREDLTEFKEIDREIFYPMDFSEGMAAVVNHEGKLGFVKNPLF